MPIEFSRTTKRKRVFFPGEDPNDPNASFVDIPVITTISFVDPVERAQEYQYSIDNSSEADRSVHVDNVYPVNEGADQVDITQDPLLVERIDKWRTIDPVARGQQSDLEFDNRTGNDLIPPRFTTHLKTHVVRYKNEPDDGNWIDSELIDQFAVVDPVNRGQESQFSLNNPQGTFDAEGKEVLTANLDDPEISDTANGIDPAWRTDPFQNIVNFSGGYYVMFIWRWSDWWYPANTDVMIASGAPVGGQPPPGSTLVPGTDTELHSQGPAQTSGTSTGDSEVEITMDTDNPEDPSVATAVLINDPETLTEPGIVINGVEILGPCGLWEGFIGVPDPEVYRPAACPVPPAPAGPPFLPRVYADTKQSYTYSKTFLFKIIKMPVDFTALIAGVTCSGIPSQKDLGTYPTNVPGHLYQPTVTATVDPPRWTGYLFSARDVKYFPDDDLVPLRPTDNPNPTAGSGDRIETLGLAMTETVHSGLAAELPLGGNVQIMYSDGEYDQRFANYSTPTTHPPRNRIVWPVTPVGITNTGGDFGTYNWRAGDNLTAVSDNILMGTPPGTQYPPP